MTPFTTAIMLTTKLAKPTKDWKKLPSPSLLSGRITLSIYLFIMNGNEMNTRTKKIIGLKPCVIFYSFGLILASSKSAQSCETIKEKYCKKLKQN